MRGEEGRLKNGMLNVEWRMVNVEWEAAGAISHSTFFNSTFNIQTSFGATGHLALNLPPAYRGFILTLHPSLFTLRVAILRVMKRTILFLLALTLVATVASADEVLRCDSRGSRRRCSFDTRGPVSITVRRQYSAASCVEGTSWGWHDGEVWVDNGCRAEFLITPRHEDRGDRGDRAEHRRDRGEVIICEAGERRHRCDAFVPYGVVMQRQLSHRDCIRGESWGFDRDGIWVDHGCRAEFYIEGEDRREHHAEHIVCESHNGQNEICEADTRFGVELTRQLSASACVFRRSWGYNDRGIWVRDGCRAEFTIRRR